MNHSAAAAISVSVFHNHQGSSAHWNCFGILGFQHCSVQGNWPLMKYIDTRPINVSKISLPDII